MTSQSSYTSSKRMSSSAIVRTLLGGEGEEKKIIPKNIRPGPGTGPARRKTKVTRSTLFDSKWLTGHYLVPSAARQWRKSFERKKVSEFQLLPLSLLDPPAPSPPKRNAAQLRVNRHRRGSIIQFGSPPVPAPPSPFASRYRPPVLKKKADHTRLSINTRANYLAPFHVCSRLFKKARFNVMHSGGNTRAHPVHCASGSGWRHRSRWVYSELPDLTSRRGFHFLVRRDARH